MTFGFQSAVNIATNAIDCIHTTASSHGRVFIVEIMGHKVGSLTLHAGVAGGADIIRMISKRLQQRSRNVQKQANASQFLQLQKVPFPKKTQNSRRRNIKRNWKQEQRNIRLFPMRSQIRFIKKSEVKYVSPYQDIHREVENLARMTVFFPQESVQVQHSPSLTVSMVS